jgi:hypothetical protein
VLFLQRAVPWPLEVENFLEATFLTTAADHCQLVQLLPQDVLCTFWDWQLHSILHAAPDAQYHAGLFWQTGVCLHLHE